MSRMYTASRLIMICHIITCQCYILYILLHIINLDIDLDLVGQLDVERRFGMVRDRQIQLDDIDLVCQIVLAPARRAILIRTVLDPVHDAVWVENMAAAGERHLLECAVFQTDSAGNTGLLGGVLHSQQRTRISGLCRRINRMNDGGAHGLGL